MACADSKILKLQADIFTRKGYATTSQKKLYEAMHYYDQSLNILDDLNLDKAYVTASIAYILYKVGDLELAEEYYKTSARENTKYKNYRNLTIDYLALGCIYSDLGRYDEAFENLEIAISIVEDKGLNIYKYDVYFDVGRLYLRIGNTKKALEHFLLAMSYHTDIEYENTIKRRKANCQAYIAKIKFDETGDSLYLNKFKKAYQAALDYDYVEL